MPAWSPTGGHTALDWISFQSPFTLLYLYRKLQQVCVFISVFLSYYKMKCALKIFFLWVCIYYFHMPVCVCIWWSEVNAGHLPVKIPTLCFCDRVSHWIQDSWILLDWLGYELILSSASASQIIGTHYSHDFMWVLGIWTQVPVCIVRTLPTDPSPGP